jgi:hypothetical protein
METTIIQTLNILGEELDVEFDVGYYIDNDGIGDYEYWGAKGNDAGSDYPVVEEIKWDESLYETWQNAEIKNKTKAETFIDNITKKIEL